MNEKEKHILSKANRFGYLIIQRHRLESDIDIMNLVDSGYMVIDSELNIVKGLAVMFVTMVGMSIRSYYEKCRNEPET